MGLLDDIIETTKENSNSIRGLLSNPIESIKNQYKQGQPYRNALASLLSGNVDQANRDISSSSINPMDFAMMLAPISVSGKASLISAMQNKGVSPEFSLGTITQGQASRLGGLLGQHVPQEVTVTPSSANHIYKSRVLNQNFTPEDVARFADEAMRPSANAKFGTGGVELSNNNLRDSLTKSYYEAKLPLVFDGDRLIAKTIIPKGLQNRK